MTERDDSAPILVPSPSNDSTIRVIPEEWKAPIKLAELESVLKARDVELEYRIVRYLSENDRMVSRLYVDETSKALNRYREMVPFKENRVTLSDGSYINASYMPGADPGKKKAYIACQGPLTHTIPDQWDMIWTEKVSGVLTIGNLKEGTTEKIAQYWPEQKGDSIEVKRGGKVFRIFCTEQRQLFQGLIERILLVELGTEKRNVNHYHFTAWPDHGAVPPSVLIALASLLKHERIAHPSEPVVVHCSAGVGRTGTVLTMSNAVESVETQLVANNGDLSKCSVSVMQTVLALRECRVHIIERTWQYESVYAAIQELVKTHKKGDPSFCPKLNDQ